MCAIVDASVVGKVFNPSRHGAAKEFFNWISLGEGRLVVGGRVLRELDMNSNFKKWRQQAIQAGRVKVINKDDVERNIKELERKKLSYKSNDAHVLALARVSGARLLYADDGNLQKDFRNRVLINNPRGKVYSTREQEGFMDSHKQILRKGRELCRNH